VAWLASSLTSRRISYLAVRVVAAAFASCVLWFAALARIAAATVSATGAVRVGAVFTIHFYLLSGLGQLVSF